MNDLQKALINRHNKTHGHDKQFTKDELDLFRQWFNAVQDLNEPYLEKADYTLYAKVKSELDTI